MPSSKPKPNQKQHIIVRIPEGSNLYQLCLFALSGTQPKKIEALTGIVPTHQANLLGKQLAKERKIPFFKKLKPALNQAQCSELARIRRQAKMVKRQQWKEVQQNRYSSWLTHYSSEQLALADAVRLMNRWIKSLGRIEPSYDLDYQTGRVTKYKVYEHGRERVWVEAAYAIKDAWIQQNQELLIDGHKVRHEVSWNGVKSRRRWLYWHQFLIDGQKFDFHSYIPPAQLSPELAPDFPPFKSRNQLSPEEITAIEKKCGINTPDAFIEMLSCQILAQKFW